MSCAGSSIAFIADSLLKGVKAGPTLREALAILHGIAPWECRIIPGYSSIVEKIRTASGLRVKQVYRFPDGRIAVVRLPDDIPSRYKVSRKRKKNDATERPLPSQNHDRRGGTRR